MRPRGRPGERRRCRAGACGRGAGMSLQSAGVSRVPQGPSRALRQGAAPLSAESAMPMIEIKLFEGRTQEQKRELALAITAETCRVLGVGPESVDVVYHDVRKSDWATGGRFWSEPRG